MDFSAITAVQRQEADRKPRLMGLRAGTGRRQEALGVAQPLRVGHSGIHF